MIKLCIFDMGGVVVRNYQVWPLILDFLDRKEEDVSSPGFDKAHHDYGLGLINEDDLWAQYVKASGRDIPPHEGSLMGKFFTPTLDQPTVAIIQKLKALGISVVCGTNTGDAHYTVHVRLGQYDIFDRVYASHLMHLAKPDPAFFTCILEAEGVKPEETFFTDDWADNIEAAVKMGIAGFLYTGADTLKGHLNSLGLPV
ncbi:MAG: HAD family phosphatase [Treponema sp.]|jgi:putative hydrolase of the HAD superfamily|nr:HAD family phosphatase [Treponema sp.]